MGVTSNSYSDNSKESNLLRELKTSLDRARSETTDGGYAASETASLFFSENSTRESSPHKPRIVPIQIEPPKDTGFQRTSTPKTMAASASTEAVINTTTSSSISRSGCGHGTSGHSTTVSLGRHASDTSYDRTRPLIQRRLRYDSEGEQSANGGGSGLGAASAGLNRSAAGSNISIDSINSRPITPGFPTVPPTPIFGRSAAG